MSVKKYNGSSFVDVGSTMKRYVGTTPTDLTFIRRWSGSAWIDCWTSRKTLTKIGNTTLSLKRKNVGGASVGNYALFGGGLNEWGQVTNLVDAFDTNLTRSQPTGLVYADYAIGASVGNYALMAGSGNGGNVSAYDTSLVRSTPTYLPGRCAKAVSMGNYALFAGDSGIVSAYDINLVKTTPAALAQNRYGGDTAGAAVGGYGLFAGGSKQPYNSWNYVDFYDSNLAHTLGSLSVARNSAGGASVTGYAIIAGGMVYVPNGEGGYDGVGDGTVDAFNASLVRSSTTALSVARYGPLGVATRDKEIAIFYSAQYYGSTAVDTYDKNLLRGTTGAALGAPASAGTSVGNFILYSGFDPGSGYSSDYVDVYQES